MPENVKDAFLKILFYTLIDIRANAQNAARCQTLADHAHNIPGLISDYTDDIFKYYWELERQDFINQMEKIGETFASFREPWAILEGHHARLKNLGGK